MGRPTVAELARSLAAEGVTVLVFYQRVARLRSRRFVALERAARTARGPNGRPPGRLCVTALGRQAVAGFLRIGPAR